MDTALSFDDVLLVPQKTDIESRRDVDISTEIAGVKLQIPIISANMSTVTERQTAFEMARLGGLGIIHRMCEIEEQVFMVLETQRMIEEVNSRPCGAFITGPVGAAIGIGDDWLERATSLIGAGADIICIDVAHAHQTKVKKVVDSFRDKFGSFPLIVGNVATREAALDLVAGCQNNIAVKVGIGGGSMCSTRVQTGHGLPTLFSVVDVASAFSSSRIIADGGIKSSGDIVKSLAAGAGAVMIGSLIAGCEETPGRIIKNKDKKYKVYRGEASFGAKMDYLGHSDFIEGEETLVPYKGKLENVIKNLCDGIKSGFSYSGARNIRELKEKAQFVQITQSGYRESIPHGAL